MNATGIIRRMDDLGRIIIPKDIRRFLNLKEGDPLEIYIHEQGVLYRKYNPAKPVKTCLDTLKKAVKDEPMLSRADELLKKIAELETLLEQEQTVDTV